MTRTTGLIWGGIAGLLVVAAFYWVGPPAMGGEACKGRLVKASWYGSESGNRTASGKHFDGSQWLVAHKSLPFGTNLRLSYKGKSVVVPVEDRGPFIAGRELDLSAAVAKALGTKQAGVAVICMVRL